MVERQGIRVAPTALAQAAAARVGQVQIGALGAAFSLEARAEMALRVQLRASRFFTRLAAAVALIVRISFRERQDLVAFQVRHRETPSATMRRRTLAPVVAVADLLRHKAVPAAAA
jgi:hypothetical protein